MNLSVQKNAKTFSVALGPLSPHQEPHEFHFIWLRDNCTCKECFFVSSQQKVFSCASLPLDVHPQEYHVDGDKLFVTWSDEHKSVYTKEYLSGNVYSENTLQQRRTALKPMLWEARDIDQKHSVDYESFMNNDTALMKVLKTFLDYGIVFITGVPRSEPNGTPSVEKVIQRIGPVRETFYGRMFDVVNHAGATNMAFTASRLELHQDMVYYESVPPVQLLHCMIQSTKGGENVFVDSYQAAELLEKRTPEHFETLLRVPVGFHRIVNGHNFSPQKPILYRNENLYIGVNYSPHNHGPLRASPSDVEAWYAAFAEFSKIIYSDDLKLTKKLAEGELVMFDNRRVLHGRASYSPGEARHLQGAYLGMDEVWDKFSVLKWKCEHPAS